MFFSPVNQSAYLKLGCTQGWFFGSLFQSSLRLVIKDAPVYITYGFIMAEN